MSYDYFIGLPERRIIRLAELRPYFEAETASPTWARAKDLTRLPAPVQKAVDSIQARWPARPSDAQSTDNPQFAGYTLGISSASVSFHPSQSAEAHRTIIGLATELELLCFDCTNGGWLDAQRPNGNVLTISAFTSERCIMPLVGLDDPLLLFDPQWFVAGQFFCLVASPGQFLQFLNNAPEILIEFRSGPERPIYRTRMTEMGPVMALLAGYFRGQNMNTQANRFTSLASLPDPDIGLPRRDAEGRWTPLPARTAAELHLT